MTAQQNSQFGLLTLAFLAALIACGYWITRSAWAYHAQDIHDQWLIVEASLLVLCMIAGYIAKGRIDGILIDEQNRISLERTQWIAWLIVLLGGYFTEAVWNVALGQSFPEMKTYLFGLLGIVGASAVTSNVIVDAKKNDSSAPPPPANAQIGTPTQQGMIDCNVSSTEASWADLYLGEEVANRETVDVSRLQKLIITILLIMTYVQQLWTGLSSTLAHATGTPLVTPVFAEMPQFDETRLWLLGISHAAYLAYKATPKTPAPQQAQTGP
jgi:hypothetical protein